MTKFLLGADLQNRILLEKLAGYFSRFSADARPFEPPVPVDPILAEIGAIERAFARQLAQTRSARRKASRTKPVTPEEKILDLSG